MKRKLLLILTIITTGCFLNSCDESLDIQPLNILTSDQVFQSQSAIEAYIASLYNAIDVEDFAFTGVTYLANCTDEAITKYTDQVLNIGNGTNTPWWGYSNVRQVNDFLAKLPSAEISGILKETYLGEAHFIRAFYYFAMVKRYGGIPIITEVQNFSGNNLDELQVPRDKEQDVYDFIADDLDQAAALLPATNVKGRATKYTALALKSRAMLYAASIAKYGSVQLNGILGIPASQADSYWQAAYDAANAVITSGAHSLYMGNLNKAANFQELFLTDNNESLLTKYYIYPDKTHTYDQMNLPWTFTSSYSSGLCPTLDCVEQFEYVDGSGGTLKIGTPSNPIFYNAPADLFAGKDPRLFGSVITPFSTFKNRIVEIQAGLYDQGIKIQTGNYDNLYNVNTHQKDNVNGTIHIIGLSGTGGGQEQTQTGFYLKKYLDPNLEIGRTPTAESDWMVIRYAEVLLNYAEAAVELKKIPEAKAKINMIRSRAGIAELDNADITIERVRHERNIELAFENQRWWDYRRWRVSDALFNNTWPRMLQTYYDIQQNKYRFEITTTGRYTKTFDPKVYYERIDPSELAKNPKLIQNPGY